MRPLSVLSVSPVLSVTLVYCGQTVGRIKMKLGMLVGLGSGHIVLDGDSATPKKEAQHPHFDPCIASIWLHGSSCNLVRGEASAQATLCYTGNQLLP